MLGSPRNPAIFLAAVLLLTPACASIRDNPKATLGGAAGAAAGGLIGAAAGGESAGIAGGVLLGGLLGGMAGHVLDQRDKELAYREAQTTLERAPTGQTSTWRNPDSGNAGRFTPTRTYQRADGRYCREFEQEILIDGEPHTSHGTACRRPDGTWEIQS